ncbi:MAG: HEAT repeat domain-containing protein [Planctomycetaceae bacterium]
MDPYLKLHRVVIVAMMLAVSASPAVMLSAGELEKETSTLLAWLPQATPDETRTILERITEIGPEARHAQGTLFRLLDSEEYGFYAAHALVSMGMEARATLRKALQHSKPDVRATVVSELVEMAQDAEPLIPDILLLLNDKDETVRNATIAALGRLRLKSSTVISALFNQLTTADPQEAASVADAFAQMGIGAREAISALSRTALTHESAYVRSRVLLALVSMDTRHQAVAKTLSAATKDTETFGNAWTISVQKIAVDELAKLNPQSIPSSMFLISLLKNHGYAEDVSYANVCFILGESGNAEAIPVLRAELEHTPRKNDSFTSTLFNDRDIPPLYTDTLDRAAAMAALAKLDRDNAKWIEKLELVLNDEQWSVAEQMGALGVRMRDPRAIAARGLGRLGADALSTLPSLKQRMVKSSNNPTELNVSAAWAVARLDSQDLECLKVIRGAMTSPIWHWNDSFAGESTSDIVRILGGRVDALLPDLAGAFLREDPWGHRFHMELLLDIGPHALTMFVDRKFQGWEREGAWEFGLGKCHALDSIGPRAEPAIDTYLKYLKSEQHFIRAKAAYQIGMIGPRASSAVPELRHALADDRVKVRFCAAQALARIGPSAHMAIDDLECLVDDPYQSIRDAAARAIAIIQEGNFGKDCSQRPQPCRTMNCGSGPRKKR